MGTESILLAVPLVITWAALLVFALVDLTRPERQVTGDSKLMWALVIVLIGTIGPLVYLLAGRKDA